MSLSLAIPELETCKLRLPTTAATATHRMAIPAAALAPPTPVLSGSKPQLITNHPAKLCPLLSPTPVRTRRPIAISMGPMHLIKLIVIGGHVPLLLCLLPA